MGTPNVFLPEIHSKLQNAAQGQCIKIGSLNDFYDQFKCFLFQCNEIEIRHVKLLSQCSIYYTECINDYIEISPKFNAENIEVFRRFLEIISDLSRIKGTADEYLKFIVQPLLEKVVAPPNARLWYRKELLKNLIIVLENSTSGVRHSVARKSLPYFGNLADILSTCGDYEYQITIIKTIINMCSEDQISMCARWMFPESDVFQEELSSITRNNVDVDSRKFLNVLNAKYENVFSFKVERIILGNYNVQPPKNTNGDISKLWVDFNKVSKTITIFCDRNSLIVDAISVHNENNLEVITIDFETIISVTTSRMVQEYPASLIIFELGKPYVVSHLSSKTATNADQLVLGMFNCPELMVLEKQILPQLFGDRFKPPQSPPSIKERRKGNVGSYKPLAVVKKSYAIEFSVVSKSSTTMSDTLSLKSKLSDIDTMTCKPRERIRQLPNIKNVEQLRENAGEPLCNDFLDNYEGDSVELQQTSNNDNPPTPYHEKVIQEEVTIEKDQQHEPKISISRRIKMYNEIQLLRRDISRETRGWFEESENDQNDGNSNRSSDFARLLLENNLSRHKIFQTESINNVTETKSDQQKSKESLIEVKIEDRFDASNVNYIFNNSSDSDEIKDIDIAENIDLNNGNDLLRSTNHVEPLGTNAYTDKFDPSTTTNLRNDTDSSDLMLIDKSFTNSNPTPASIILNNPKTKSSRKRKRTYQNMSESDEKNETQDSERNTDKKKTKDALADISNRNIPRTNNNVPDFTKMKNTIYNLTPISDNKSKIKGKSHLNDDNGKSRSHRKANIPAINIITGDNCTPKDTICEDHMELKETVPTNTHEMVEIIPNSENEHVETTTEITFKSVEDKSSDKNNDQCKTTVFEDNDLPFPTESKSKNVLEEYETNRNTQNVNVKKVKETKLDKSLKVILDSETQNAVFVQSPVATNKLLSTETVAEAIAQAQNKKITILQNICLTNKIEHISKPLNEPIKNIKLGSSDSSDSCQHSFLSKISSTSLYERVKRSSIPTECKSENVLEVCEINRNTQNVKVNEVKNNRQLVLQGNCLKVFIDGATQNAVENYKKIKALKHITSSSLNDGHSSPSKITSTSCKNVKRKLYNISTNTHCVAEKMPLATVPQSKQINSEISKNIIQEESSIPTESKSENVKLKEVKNNRQLVQGNCLKVFIDGATQNAVENYKKIKALKHITNLENGNNEKDDTFIPSSGSSSLSVNDGHSSPSKITSTSCKNDVSTKQQAVPQSKQINSDIGNNIIREESSITFDNHIDDFQNVSKRIQGADGQQEVFIQSPVAANKLLATEAVALDTISLTNKNKYISKQLNEPIKNSTPLCKLVTCSSTRKLYKLGTNEHRTAEVQPVTLDNKVIDYQTTIPQNYEIAAEITNNIIQEESSVTIDNRGMDCQNTLKLIECADKQQEVLFTQFPVTENKLLPTDAVDLKPKQNNSINKKQKNKNKCIWKTKAAKKAFYTKKKNFKQAKPSLNVDIQEHTVKENYWKEEIERINKNVTFQATLASFARAMRENERKKNEQLFKKPTSRLKSSEESKSVCQTRKSSLIKKGSNDCVILDETSNHISDTEKGFDFISKIYLENCSMVNEVIDEWSNKKLNRRQELKLINLVNTVLRESGKIYELLHQATCALKDKNEKDTHQHAVMKKLFDTLHKYNKNN